MEVILVLAVLVLLGMLLLPGVGSMLRQSDQRDGREALARVVERARGLAIANGRTVRLSYEVETRTFVVSGDTVVRLPLPAGVDMELLPLTGTGFVLRGGMLAEGSGLGHVRFFSDGTCDPFRARVRSERMPSRLLVADPWTCALSFLRGEAG
ncbi:MAG: hypothetical protein KIT44_06470 [Opitutaceae bacterium]|nr:hypothetical protein [Opitutaceae bacterium]